MEKNKTVWKYVRYSFWTAMLLWAISMYFPENAAEAATIPYILFGLAWMTSSIFCFVNCIRHLCIYKDKAFAITALVITGILNLLFAAGLLAGIMQLS